jgi:hypothetical protein
MLYIYKEKRKTYEENIGGTFALIIIDLARQQDGRRILLDICLLTEGVVRL